MTWALLKIAGLIAGWMVLTLCALILLTIFIWVGDALRKVLILRLDWNVDIHDRWRTDTAAGGPARGARG
jgi:hypothetical protein